MRINWPVTIVLFAAILLLIMPSQMQAGRVQLGISSRPRVSTIEGPFPSGASRTSIVGVPDADSRPGRPGNRVTLNWVRFCERLFSDSVLVFRPDGTGQWGYYPVFHVVRLPTAIPLRERGRSGRHAYRRLVKPLMVGGDMSLLAILRRDRRRRAL